MGDAGSHAKADGIFHDLFTLGSPDPVALSKVPNTNGGSNYPSTASPGNAWPLKK
jgi:hypothetical protein